MAKMEKNYEKEVKEGLQPRLVMEEASRFQNRATLPLKLPPKTARFVP